MKKSENIIENDGDEVDEIYVPKYPRTSILSLRNKETNNPSYSMISGFPNKIEGENHNINFFDLGLLPKKKFRTIIPNNN